MSDCSSEDDCAIKVTSSRRRRRPRLKPLQGGDSNVKEGDWVTSGFLTEVSTDYRSKLKAAEAETAVQTLKTDIKGGKPVERKRSRARLLISSSSSEGEDDEDEDATTQENVTPVPPPPPRPPSPPRHLPPQSTLSSKTVDQGVLSSLAEIQKVRRNLAEDRIKFRRNAEVESRRAFLDKFQDESLSSSAINSPTETGLRVKVHSLKSGVLRRIQMSSKDTFRVVYDVMANHEGVKVEDIRLTLRNSAVVIKAGDTYLDHDLTICDIVECVVVGENVSAGTSGDPQAIVDLSPNEVSLKVQSPTSKTGQFTTLKISKKAALKDLMERFAVSENLALEKLVFRFDGEKLDPESTPEDLDMEDDDCIDVNVIE